MEQRTDVVERLRNERIEFGTAMCLLPREVVYALDDELRALRDRPEPAYLAEVRELFAEPKTSPASDVTARMYDAGWNDARADILALIPAASEPSEDVEQGTPITLDEQLCDFKQVLIEKADYPGADAVNKCRDIIKSHKPDTNKLYHELLYSVASKYPGESRHETALRYIRQAENTPLNGTMRNGNTKNSS
jgi:hypothetical protein